MKRHEAWPPFVTENRHREPEYIFVVGPFLVSPEHRAVLHSKLYSQNRVSCDSSSPANIRRWRSGPGGNHFHFHCEGKARPRQVLIFKV